MASAPRKSTFICLLRGINVSGHKPVKMEALRGSFEALGFTRVRTYVQSGNVVFGAKAMDDARLCSTIAERLLADTGFAIPVLVRSQAEWQLVLQANPFLAEPGIDVSRLHVTFLGQLPSAASLKALAAIPAGKDRFKPDGKEVYLHCPDGYGNTRLSNTAIEKSLAVSATTRNWRTVTTLNEMAAE